MSKKETKKKSSDAVCCSPDRPKPRISLYDSDVINGVDLGDTVELVVKAKLTNASVADYDGEPRKTQDFIIDSVTKKGESKSDNKQEAINDIAKLMRGGKGGMK